MVCCRGILSCFSALRISVSGVLYIRRRSVFCSRDPSYRRTILLGGVIPIEDAAALWMSFPIESLDFVLRRLFLVSCLLRSYVI